MVVFLAHFLIVLAAWTLTIKFALPLALSDLPGARIYWDFWWVAHLWLAWWLLAGHRLAYALALGVSIVEIVIVVTKFVLFLSAPDWTIWTANWFINKIFVLACFCLMLGWLIANRRRIAWWGKEAGHDTELRAAS